MGTAGLARCLVSGYSRVPAPPPRMTAATLLVLTFSPWGQAGVGRQPLAAGHPHATAARSSQLTARARTVAVPAAAAVACATTAVATAERCRQELRGLSGRGGRSK